MITKQEKVQEELQKGNSIAWWATGFYKTVGNKHTPSLNIPIFGIQNEEQPVMQVMIEYLGSMVWINVRKEQVFYGVGPNRNYQAMGVHRRLTLEAIRRVN